MPVTQTRQDHDRKAQTTDPRVRFFTRHVVGNEDVCANCYRLLWETYERNYIRKAVQDSDAEDTETGGWTTKYVDVLEPRPPIRIPVLDRIDRDERGLWCSCGSDGRSQPDERPRSVEKARRHARNLATTLNELGLEIDEEKLVRATEEVRAENNCSGTEVHKEAIRRVEDS
jgi:hypothetical protein